MYKLLIKNCKISLLRKLVSKKIGLCVFFKGRIKLLMGIKCTSSGNESNSNDDNGDDDVLMITILLLLVLMMMIIVIALPKSGSC